MSFPYIFQENFERGTKGNFDTETDTDGILDFAHYKELARFPWPGCAPYSGAYAMRITPNGGTNPAVLVEADTNIADTVTNWFRFPIWFSPTFTGTADDTFHILELTGLAGAVTVTIGGRIVAATNAINLGVGGAATGAVPTVFTSQDIERGIWYTCEVKVVIQTGGTGTVDLYLTKDGIPQQTTAVASVTTITNIAVTDSNFGLKAHLATTTGMILLGGLVQDDTQIYIEPRYNNDPSFTQSGHAFVGPGWISGAALLTNEATNQMILWDTDLGDTVSPQNQKVFFDVDNQTSLGGDFFFQNGCYVDLSGTDPRGQVMLARNSQTPGVFGPLYRSDNGVRHWARGDR